MDPLSGTLTIPSAAPREVLHETYYDPFGGNSHSPYSGAASNGARTPRPDTSTATLSVWVLNLNYHLARKRTLVAILAIAAGVPALEKFYSGPSAAP